MTFSNADAASKHGAWTYEEDKLLAKYQEIHGNRWSLVAVNIPGRTGQQCAQRWRHKVNPDIRKEKWTADEDRLLASLVAEHGNRWADIARHMPGRTDQQCMGRWRRHLDPNIRKCQWQTHEDELLKQQYEALGPQWSNISKFLQGRTAQQCRARWFQLCPASAAPPVPRTARNQSGRRDRHHDGASIQESARHLVAQMVTQPSNLTWEGTRTRTRSAKPRKRFSPIMRDHSPEIEIDEADCHTPRGNRTDSMKALEAEALEAAAALTEMAGGPRVHPSPGNSPPSVRAPDPPMLNGFGGPASLGQWVSANKDASCCTPAKRPAAVPLWDGPSSSKHSRPGLLDATPSHMHMHTPIIQHLAASPGFGASPLPANQDAVVMTPGSRNMLRSMPLDPIDRMDLPGDFSPGLLSSQGTEIEPTGAAATLSPHISSAKPSDLCFNLGMPDPRSMKRGVVSVVTPAICGGMHGDRHAKGSPRALQSAPLQGPPTRRSLVFLAEQDTAVEGSGVDATLLNAPSDHNRTPAQVQRECSAVLQPPSTALSCPLAASTVEDKFFVCMPAPDALCAGDTALLPHANAYSQHLFRGGTRADSSPPSARLPITPNDGLLASQSLERRTSGGISDARMRSRKQSFGGQALEHAASAFNDIQCRSLNGVENNACDVQQSMAISHHSPQLGVQTLSPPLHSSRKGCGVGYSVGGVGVSLSPPGSIGAADHSGECKGDLSPPAGCDSESKFVAAEHRTCTRQMKDDSRMNADCTAPLNGIGYVKAVSNNSSTGKSSGVSSLDGVVPRHDSNAVDASALKLGRGQADGSQKIPGGDASGDNGRQMEDDGSYSIRQKLHSLVDDVFACSV